jgi:hypothetical protein
MAQVFDFDYGQNVKQIHYDVYLKLHDDDAFVQVGQCITDSVLNTYEGEDTVELNISGDINVSSRGTIAFDIAHLTTDNINAMRGHDKKSFDVCLKTVDPVEENGTDHIYMSVRDVIYNYRHNFGGGEVNTLPVSFTKKVASPDQWDTIAITPPADHPDST